MININYIIYICKISNYTELKISHINYIVDKILENETDVLNKLYLDFSIRLPLILLLSKLKIKENNINIFTDELLYKIKLSYLNENIDINMSKIIFELS